MKTAKILAAIAVVAAVALALGLYEGGSKEKDAGKSERPAVKTVAVSILPQAYFVERISGGKVRALVLVGPGQSPHSYEPTPRQMRELAEASAWFVIGVDFEKSLVPKVSSLYPNLPIVDTVKNVKYRELAAHDHEGEENRKGEKEGGKDLHVWLGRQAALAMADEIRNELIALDPDGAAAYRANRDAFAKDADAVFDNLAKELAPLRGKTVFVYHPSFGYFLDEFGIGQEAVETGGKEPTQKHLARLIEEARKDGTKVIFVQEQFPTAAAETVAKAIGGTVAKIDPLAPDWLDNLGRIGEALKRSAR